MRQIWPAVVFPQGCCSGQGGSRGLTRGAAAPLLGTQLAGDAPAAHPDYWTVSVLVIVVIESVELLP